MKNYDIIECNTNIHMYYKIEIEIEIQNGT